MFALIALLLAAGGLYGVLSHAVAQRTNEIGIRLALGARAGRVLGMVVRQGLVLVLAGLGLGLAAALAIGSVLTSLLFGVSARDGVTYAAVSVLLLGAGALACFFPARRAVSVDPLIALRRE